MIVVYGAPNCLMCQQTVALVERYQFKYTYKDVSVAENKKEFLDKFPSTVGVPQITWHDRWIGGYAQLLEEIENTMNYGQDKF